MDPTRWQRLKSLYDSVLDLSVQGRRGYLARLRQRSLAAELGRMLDREGELEGFLEPVPSGDEQPSPPVRALQPGDVLADRYESGEFVGAGGMGEVYRAFDREMQQWVALKTLRPELASQPTLIASLRKEVRLARRITHPNICRLYDVGRAETRGGQAIIFFTMELLEGRTLAEIVREQPLPPQDAVHLACQIISGLAAAHAAGIIHRDLKGGNIIVTTDAGGVGRAVITDFGLAREQEAPVRETVTAFGPNSIVGTPAYMSPEQLEGRPATSASDVYSLGVVLFEMVSGRLPIENNSPLVIALRRVSEPAPDVRTVAPDAPAEWAAAIHACLERNPSNRPRSASEVEQLLRGEGGPRRRFSRRSAIGATLGLAATAAGLQLATRNRARPVAPEAKRHYEVGQVFANRRTTDNLANAIKEYDAAVKIEPSYADAWAGLADAYSAMANYNFMPPREGLDKARQAATRAVELSPDSGRANGAIAYVISIDLRRWLQAGLYFERAVRLNPQEPLIRLWYGAWLGKRGQPAAALAQLNAGLERDPASFNLHHQRAVEYFRARRFPEFLAEAREVVRLQPYEAGAHLSLGRALEWMGRFDEARKSCDNAAKFGYTPAAICGRACVEAAAGNLPEAERLAVTVYQYWKNGPFETLSLAQLFSRLRGPDDVVAILEEGYGRDDSTVLGAPASPYLEKWRQEPSFRAFLGKLGLA